MNNAISRWFFIAMCVLGNVARAAIVYPDPPKDGKQVVYEELSVVHHWKNKFIGDFSLKALTIQNPYRGYDVAKDDIVSGRLVSAARFVSWRYLIFSGNSSIGEMELVCNSKTNNVPRFYALNQAPPDGSMMKAIKSAQQLPQIRARDYELRHLSIVDLNLTMVWLHSKTDDIFIPAEVPP